MKEGLNYSENMIIFARECDETSIPGTSVSGTSIGKYYFERLQPASYSTSGGELRKPNYLITVEFLVDAAISVL